MRLLLDTHVVVWTVLEARDVSDHAREAIETASSVFVSVLAFAEIGIKTSIGKLLLPHDIRAELQEQGVRILPLEAEHGLAVGRLPLHHRDPFDRLLIAQARSERLTIVTADPWFARYDVPVITA